MRAPQTAPLEDLDPVSSTALRHFIRTYSTVPDLPVAVSLRSFALLDLSGARAEVLDLVRALLAQLAAFHSPDDLRIGLCLAVDRYADWEWAKWLPHAQATPTKEDSSTDAAGTARLVAGNLTALAELFGPDLGERPMFSRSTSPGFDYRHLLVIVDGGDLPATRSLVPSGGRYAVTMIDVSGAGAAAHPAAEHAVPAPVARQGRHGRRRRQRAADLPARPAATRSTPPRPRPLPAS